MTVSGTNLTKDKLIGMKVIDSKGNLVGTVKDIAFTIGKAGISLSVEGKKGETHEIPWDQVQAAGDFILMKAQPETQAQPQQATAQICPTCKGSLKFIEQYQRWYCYKCKKYV